MSDTIGDINIMENDYIVPIEFKGYKSSTVINYNYRENGNFNILIEDSEDNNSVCLYISLRHNKFEKMDTGYIEYVSTRDRRCPIPERNGGTWILELIDVLICDIGIHYISLEDDSNVICKENNSDTHLTMLRIYGGGNSWYEKFGFKHRKFIDDKYDQSVKSYISTPLTQIQDEILKHPVIGELLNRANIALDILQVHPPSYNETLGNYMTRLWKIDCSSYIKFEDFSASNLYSWNKYRRIIFSQNSEFEKYLIC
jgi:hypothetical protein